MPRGWKTAGGEVLAPVASHTAFPSVEGAIAFGAIDLAISRTNPAYGDRQRITEIERLYIDMIMSAKKIVYAESQYFASRAVAQAIAKRLAESDGPEFVLVNPVKSDNWLGSIAMDTARARLRESLRRYDLHDRFRIYHPVTANGEPIYVHSKLMIVDQELMRVGSSNFNNRSMRFDNECDVAFETRGSHALKTKLRDLRNDLLGEHLDVGPVAVFEAIEREGSVIAALESLRLKGDSVTAQPSRMLVPYKTPDLSDLTQWLADNEILDPEGPEEVFELIEKRGRFRGRLKRPFSSA